MLDVHGLLDTPVTPYYSPRQDKLGRKGLYAGPVVVAIPAYNEERFIGSIVLQALQHVPNVIVVDDGSSDNTAQVARLAGAEVLQHKINMGKSQAVNTALVWARSHNVAALVLVDGDGQHNPAEIAQVLGPILSGEADLVIGSRFLSTRSRIPAYRVVGQHALTVITNLASSIVVTDSQSGFRAFSRRALEVMVFQGSGLSVESEMQFHVLKYRLALKEVPISVVYSEPSKRNPLAHGMQVLTNIIKLVGQHRPLLFFGTQGLLLLSAAFVTLALTLSDYTSTQVLSLGLVMLSGFLLVLALLAWSIGLVLHSIRSGFVELGHRIQHDQHIHRG